MYRLSVLTDFWPLTTLAFVAAVVAVFYFLSVQPGEVLSFWARWVNKRYERFCIDGANGPEDAANRLTRYQWVLKPVLNCPRCIAGQIGLWLCVLIVVTGGLISLLSIAYVISLASLLAILIHKEIIR